MIISNKPFQPKSALQLFSDELPESSSPKLKANPVEFPPLEPEPPPKSEESSVPPNIPKAEVEADSDSTKPKLNWSPVESAASNIDSPACGVAN